MSRRHFFKVAGGAAVATGVALAACDNNNGETSTSGAIAEADVPKDKMTYRTNPNTGDRVSLLGYGMMRLPVEGGESGRENADAAIDQELVNKEVDFALAHGVNYFDTSPAYCQGRSEHATGIALSRHPRDKYLIATKLSNFDPATWPLEQGQQMFYNSLKELQVDYVDYLLLHGVGMGDNGPEEFDHRYAENGLLDWLQEQNMLNGALNPAPAEVLILPMTQDLTAAAEAATFFRGCEIRAQLYTEQKKFKAKMGYADKLGIPFVAFLGEDEAAQNKISLKNMQTGEQQLLSLTEAANVILEDMRVRNNGKLIKG